ncbi:hypothetical protein, partial [Yoonia sp.]|uniref:hypothetical protein n=1 Tax=Yoonia sp. TaxID=2212373 RepID=UPI00391A3C08
RQIEKASIVRQVGQFAKSMQFTSARNTHHKHQYRESGFVLGLFQVILCTSSECPPFANLTYTTTRRGPGSQISDAPASTRNASWRG